ncbi:MAG: class I SAM-dependent methyltransferase [Pseudomonadota bacterium]
MVSHPEPHPVSTLFDIIEGPIRFQLVDWAFRRGVFDACWGGSSAQELAQEAGLDRSKAALALRALAALGLLREANGRFHLASEVAPYLCRAGDRCLAATFASLAEIRHHALEAFDQVLERSYDVEEEPFGPDHWDRARASLHAFHRAIAADHMLPCLTGLPEWPRARLILDLGAGSTVLAEEICRAKPEVEVVVFDLPPSIRQFETSAAALTLAPGDYTDPASIPEGPFDVIWASMSLYFHNTGLAQLLRDLAARLSPEGVLVSFHEDLNTARTAPSEHVVGRLMPALTGRDVSFSNGEVASAMQSAGLCRISSELRHTPFGLYRLDVGRAP